MTDENSFFFFLLFIVLIIKSFKVTYSDWQMNHSDELVNQLILHNRLKSTNYKEWLSHKSDKDVLTYTRAIFNLLNISVWSSH